MTFCISCDQYYDNGTNSLHACDPFDRLVVAERDLRKYRFKLGESCQNCGWDQGQCYCDRPLPPVSKTCPIPPKGWWCSRDKGHDGPCAARPTSNSVDDLNASFYREIYERIDRLLTNVNVPDVKDGVGQSMEVRILTLIGRADPANDPAYFERKWRLELLRAAFGTEDVAHDIAVSKLNAQRQSLKDECTHYPDTQPVLQAACISCVRPRLQPTHEKPAGLDCKHERCDTRLYQKDGIEWCDKCGATRSLGASSWRYPTEWYKSTYSPNDPAFVAKDRDRWRAKAIEAENVVEVARKCIAAWDGYGLFSKAHPDLSPEPSTNLGKAHAVTDELRIALKMKASNDDRQTD